jgi:deazaflavin-dependent oxidoreductase (nitroreductase family)
MEKQRKYLRPNRFGKVANAIAIRLGLATSLTIRGRTSGQPREVAVAPIELDGQRYLIGARGETDWVRNLRAAGEGELRKGGKREHFRATELTGEEQQQIARAYRDQLGKQVAGYFEKLPDPADHPVFRIEPA